MPQIVESRKPEEISQVPPSPSNSISYDMAIQTIFVKVEIPTPKNPYGFKYSQIHTDTVKREKDFMFVMSLEIHGIRLDDRMVFRSFNNNLMYSAFQRQFTT